MVQKDHKQNILKGWYRTTLYAQMSLRNIIKQI